MSHSLRKLAHDRGGRAANDEGGIDFDQYGSWRLVDEAALVRALSEGWIAGAGIDVYEKLPMFDSHPVYIRHPLFDLDNVVLTPHSAGTSIESLSQLKLDGAREAITVLNGRAPQHWVNPDVLPTGSVTGHRSGPMNKRRS